MQFTVTNRYTGAVQFTAEIACDEEASHSLKLGLAVRWAFANKVSMRDAYLSGANLSGAYLSGANLSGANLSGAYLRDAYLSGANLRDAYLRGANLRDAYLSDAYLSGANLSGANLSGANLRGAYLSGEKVSRLIASVSRLDGYAFMLFEMQEGPAKIAAGCRFLTVAAYREHVAAEYPDTDKAAETLRILDFFEATERANPKPAVTEQAA